MRETHILTITFIAIGGWIRFDRRLEEASAKDYDVVIVPGGVWNPDTLRGDAKAIGFVQEAAAGVKSSPRSATVHGSFRMPD